MLYHSRSVPSSMPSCRCIKYFLCGGAYRIKRWSVPTVRKFPLGFAFVGGRAFMLLSVAGECPTTKIQAKSPVNMTGLFAFLVCLFLLGIVSALFDCAHLSASDEMQW